MINRKKFFGSWIWEVKTSHYLKEKLKQADINVKECTKTGILAEIEGSEEGTFIGLRGDMDALPFQDEGQDILCPCLGS